MQLHDCLYVSVCVGLDTGVLCVLWCAFMNSLNSGGAIDKRVCSYGCLCVCVFVVFRCLSRGTAGLLIQTTPVSAGETGTL